MSLLDYSHPDIVFGCADIVYQRESGADTIVVIRSPSGHLPIRVHARRGDKSHIMCCTYHTWDCTNDRNGTVCGYAPGHEDMPPIPGQHCHNCGGLRAEAIPIATRIGTSLES